MTTPDTIRAASRLVYKALLTSLHPQHDASYRELLGMYRADPQFAQQVQAVAEGMELQILDFSERGLILAPTSRDSRFAVRLSDLRQTLTPEGKAALVLAHVAVAAVFYPTTDGLEDENYFPPPASVAQFRDLLHSLARRLKEIGEPETLSLPPELTPGWELICALPSTIRTSKRAHTTSISGMVSIAISNMLVHGLVRLDRDSADAEQATYTPTHRFRVQLRDLTLRRLFEIAQNVAQPQ